MKTQLSIQVFPAFPGLPPSRPGLRVKPLDDPVDGVKAIAWG